MPRRADNSDRGVLITEESARRIASAIGRGESDRRNVHAPRIRTAHDDVYIRLGKTTEDWDKGTLGDVTIYENGTPPGESAASPAEVVADCVNKFADILADRWVMIALAGNGRWYVISAEC